MSESSRTRRFPVQWKLLTAFTAAFTIVFAFIAFWVVNYASQVAMDRLKAELVEATEGAARDLPARDMAALVEAPEGSAVRKTKPYRHVASDLASVKSAIPAIVPYTFSEQSGQLYYLVNDGPFKESVASTVPEHTLSYMRQGLAATTFQPANTDAFGTWISAYSPVVDKQGTTIAAVGMDYSLQYVKDVQAKARAQVLPVLVFSYVSLILLVVVVSTLLVRPLRRLTAATRRIADGEYDLDLEDVAPRRTFTDEMTDLAESITVMAGKVAARERALSKEVQRLRVEIDQVKREESVREITETEFFADLASKAHDLRARMRQE